MEEEKAVWSAREKASIEAIEDKSRYFKAENALLSKETSEVNLNNFDINVKNTS